MIRSRGRVPRRIRVLGVTNVGIAPTSFAPRAKIVTNAGPRSRASRRKVLRTGENAFRYRSNTTRFL